MKTQKVRNLAIVAVAAMLLATTAISMSTTTQSAFAYKKNQATSQANACGNDFFPTNVGCQNTGSQIQGDENAVALTAQQTFPAAQVTPPVPDGEECIACLSLLSEAQLKGVATQLKLDPSFDTKDEIIAEICRLLELGPSNGGISVGRVNGAMASSGLIDNDLRKEVRDCLRAIEF